MRGRNAAGGSSYEEKLQPSHVPRSTSTKVQILPRFASTKVQILPRFARTKVTFPASLVQKYKYCRRTKVQLLTQPGGFEEELER